MATEKTGTDRKETGTVRLASKTYHIIVDSGHTSMLFRNDVAEFVESFLREGRFSCQVMPIATSID